MKRQEYRRQQKFSKRKKLILLSTIAAVSFVVVSLISLRIYAQVAGAPPLTVPKATVFLDSNNQQIGDYFTEERRYWVDLEDISPYLLDATIAVEDKDFYEHSGFDFSRIGGAIVADIKAGGKVQGASTLTQQYARNLYLSHEKTWTRKLNEALYAYRIEVFYDKDEILEGYLNTVYYGHGMYGVEAASRYFYGKSASELTLAEAAMLAGVPKGPSVYSPIVNPEKASNRQQLILKLMTDQNKITSAEKEKAVAETLAFKSEDWSASKTVAPYFLDVVWTEASDILEKQNLSISEGGWTIKTTLNIAHQQAAEQAVQDNMPDSELQVAFVSMEANSGHVTALVGGRDYSASSYNRATLAARQPGSTLKPFLYTAALEEGESPLTFKDVSKTTFTYDRGRGEYTPQNINGKFAEHELSMAQALAISDNIYAVRTLEDIGYDTFNETLERFKLPVSDKKEPSLALGTTETSLYDLTNAYNVFPSQGEVAPATTVLSITNAKGDVIYEWEAEKEEVVSEQQAFMMTHMMTGMFDNVYSDYSPATGVSLRSKMTHTYAGKSGTTNSDQWMIGFSNSMTAGVWNGYDQGKTLSVQADMAASKQIWLDFMETVHEGKADEAFTIPNGIEAVTVDITSGKIANKACQEKQKTIYITKELMPTEQCTSSWFDGDWFDFNKEEQSDDEPQQEEQNDSTPWRELLDWFNFGT